jgi:phosphoglycolate phosphatase-like HAD superfamily hydrolase
MRAHIVWDWNGTLFDDLPVVVAASNAAFAEFGIAPLSIEKYRETYCIPILDFYERLMGRRPSPDEWQRMDASFHAHYSARRDACGLTPGAESLLTQWTGTGARSQSLLSMYGHDELVPLVRRLGLERHFLRVDGRDGTSGLTGKSQYLVRHLTALAPEGITPGSTVLIGDAVDDALAAAHAGAHAVLFAGGSHARSELERVGVPVADTLAEAVAFAQDLVKS